MCLQISWVPSLEGFAVRDEVFGYRCCRHFCGFETMEHWEEDKRASWQYHAHLTVAAVTAGMSLKTGQSQRAREARPGTGASLHTCQSEVSRRPPSGSPGMLARSVGSGAPIQSYWIGTLWDRSFSQGHVWEMLPLASSSQDFHLLFCHWLDPFLMDKHSLSSSVILCTSSGPFSWGLRVYTLFVFPLVLPHFGLTWITV